MGSHMALKLDYPSQRFSRTPPEPMLLDTCAVQHLDTVLTLCADERSLDEECARTLITRYGSELGPELVALADLYARFRYNGAPWAVSETSLVELERVGGGRGAALLRWWWDLCHYWDSCEEFYPEVDFAGLAWPQPDVSPDQLTLFEMEAVAPGYAALDEPLALLRDVGDRALVRDAIRAGIPSVLTTDLRSFWRRRHDIYGYGIEVWRPTDVLRAYGGEVFELAA
jgi:hypothetical protein